MLAISQGTLMKLLEISKKRLLAACLAVGTVMLHCITHNKRERKESDVNISFETIVHLFETAIRLSMIKHFFYYISIKNQ